MNDLSVRPLFIRPATACDVVLLSALQAACYQPAAASEGCPDSSNTGASPSASPSASPGTGVAVHVGEAWRPRSWAEVLAMPGSFALLATVREPGVRGVPGQDAEGHGADDEPVGFFLAQVLFAEGELLSFGVVPAHRRRGYGRRLLAQGLEVAQRQGAERIQLEVAENNRRAQSFYKTAGFSLIGRRPGYYRLAAGDAVDALILQRLLM